MLCILANIVKLMKSKMLMTICPYQLMSMMKAMFWKSLACAVSMNLVLIAKFESKTKPVY